jgi:cation diffusion facilitator family transporter
MKDQERKRYLKKAENLQIYNIFYDVVEVAVSLTAGIASGSSALIGWGLDSVVEVISASTLWWRLNGESRGASVNEIKKREKLTLYVIAASFALISAFITYDSITKLINQSAPSWSSVGIGVLVVSLIVNPILILYKYKYGKKLNNKELIADSKDTFICLYQTVAVLSGLLAVQYLDWWWADPVAALLIVPYALKEGWSIFKSARKVQYSF